MGKLHKFKKWLTVAETANYLTILLAEPVSEADVLHLAVEGEIDISVNFVNGVRARKMKAVAAASAKTLQLLTHTGELAPYIVGVPLGSGHYLQADGDATPVEIDGIWDLNLFPNDRLDLERKLYRLIDGPEVTRCAPLQGIYVFREEDDLIYELMESKPEEDLKKCCSPLSRERVATMDQINPRR